MRHLFAISALMFAFHAWSNVSVPAPFKGHQPPQQQSACCPQQTSSSQNVTVKSPVEVKLLNSGKTTKEADEDTKEREDKASSDRWMICLTGILGLIAFLQLIAFGAQAIYMRKAFFSEEDTAKRQLRAYVGHADIEIDMPSLRLKNYAPQKMVPGILYKDFILIGIKNFGNTPAYDVSIVIGQAPRPFMDKLPIDFNYSVVENPSDLGFVSRQSLQPGQRVVTQAAQLDVTPFKQAQAKTISLFLFGTIRYTDIYGQRWANHFCFAYEPFRPHTFHFTPYEKNNYEEKIPPL